MNKTVLLIMVAIFTIGTAAELVAGRDLHAIASGIITLVISILYLAERLSTGRITIKYRDVE